MEQKDGGPAFARAGSHSAWGQQEGMTLRDYFAAQAMSGMYAAFKHWPWDGQHEEVAKHAYQAADAMLTARSHP